MSEETLTQAVETPAAESTETSTFQDNSSWSDEQFIENAVKGLQGEETKTEEAAEEVKEEAAEEVVEEVVEEEKAEEEVSEEATLEEKEEEEEESALDLEDTFGPKDLDAKINANPELKKAIEADPALKGALYKSARLAKEYEAIKEVLPTKEAAMRAVQDASTWREADQAFLSGDPKTFMSSLVKMATITGADGKPVLDANGKVQVAPELIKFLDFVGENESQYRLGQWQKEAEAAKDEEYLAALEIIKERQSASRSEASDVPEHLKTLQADLEKQRQELARTQEEAKQSERKAFETGVADSISEKVGKLINPVLDKAALTDFYREKAEEEIHNRLTEALQNNRDYQTRLQEINRLPIGSDAKKKQVALVIEHVNAALPRIVKEVMAKAGKPVLDAQKSKSAKVTAQQARSKTEIQGTQTPATSKNLSGNDLLTHLEAEYAKTHNGEKPSGAKLIELSLEYKQKAARG